LQSSISFPLGARPTYFTFVTCSSSFSIRSPPLSPSRRAVASRSLVRRFMESGTFAPSRAMVFVRPQRIRFIMSARPSTTIISREVSSVGPAGRSSGPNFSTLPTFMVSLISLYTSSTLGRASMFHLWRISLARSIMTFRLASRMSSIFSRVTFEPHGPMRFMLSMLAVINAVETRSRLVGIVMEPFVRSFFEYRSISILPMRPVFCSSRRSSSEPKSPSV